MMFILTLVWEVTWILKPPISKELCKLILLCLCQVKLSYFSVICLFLSSLSACCFFMLITCGLYYVVCCIGATCFSYSCHFFHNSCGNNEAETLSLTAHWYSCIVCLTSINLQKIILKNPVFKSIIFFLDVYHMIYTNSDNENFLKLIVRVCIYHILINI